MTQQQLQTPISLCGKLINALFGASISDEEHMVKALDEAIPLLGASHADVVEYVVEIPMRYAPTAARFPCVTRVSLLAGRPMTAIARCCFAATASTMRLP